MGLNMIAENKWNDRFLRYDFVEESTGMSIESRAWKRLHFTQNKISVLSQSVVHIFYLGLIHMSSNSSL